MAPMSSRERLLTALSNGRPDRLPCQVHGWMDYYLKTYLGGADCWQAYERFGMDMVLYASPEWRFSDKMLANWQVKKSEPWIDQGGNRCWREVITTPKGELTTTIAANQYTTWETEHIIKDERDFELWSEFVPYPVGADFTQVRQMRERLGDRGIIRIFPFGYGQMSPWQSFCTLIGTETAIMQTMIAPDFVHHALESILKKFLAAIDTWEDVPADMTETGGGAGSNTVVSPALFREFCLPYDQREHAALKERGLKIVYHLCGGLMQMLEMVAENGADGLETMTPASMGGDCNLAEASRRIGDKLFFVGGFDQNAGFENGTPERARQLVYECFEATREHAGYIISPSDHFFHGDPACVQAFADAARECVY